ncbi:hypothetical protein GCM10010116_38310 [Microbispora rosea subsp. aerata]|nr:hypothetical protein GCM10010116_38310 [Microbispora rosea subsp. aerata]GIH54271.1 hypothetical protein Mro02_11850 [Microbispora rosea subsp. aerata]GLJ81550.1 hypothetical protein GCM10017588_02740 [Microbispora rosea subsp. aerata]
MCLSCGYGEPDDDHGDSGHITRTDPRKAGRAADASPAQAADDVGSGMESLGAPPS